MIIYDTRKENTTYIYINIDDYYHNDNDNYV